jgi:hypothetical protein
MIMMRIMMMIIIMMTIKMTMGIRTTMFTASEMVMSVCTIGPLFGKNATVENACTQG